MRVPDTARLVRIALDGTLSAAEGALLVRGEAHPFALAGDWAGGGALVGSEPLLVAGPEEDPFELLDRQPRVEAPGSTRSRWTAARARASAAAGSAIWATTWARASSAFRRPRRGECRCPASRSRSTTTSSTWTPAVSGGSRRSGRMTAPTS